MIAMVIVALLFGLIPVFAHMNQTRRENREVVEAACRAKDNGW